jgi:hypothetical protein
MIYMSIIGANHLIRTISGSDVLQLPSSQSSFCNVVEITFFAN